jgi:outer membrane protein assembly factor BamA
MLAAALALALATAQSPPPVVHPLDGLPIKTVTVSGLRHLDESVVTQQIQTKPGGLFSEEVAARDVVRLERLRVFSSISITPRQVSDGVEVAVTTVETPRLFPALSLAITDESGVSVGPAVKLVNIAGRPIDVGIVSQFGGNTVLAFSETSPLFTHRRLWHSASLALRDRTNRLESFRERSLDLDARAGVHGGNTWQLGGIFQLYNVYADDSSVTLSGEDRDSFPGFGGVFIQDTRNSLTTPRRGWWNTVDVVKHVGSGTYTTLNLDLRRYQPVTGRQSLVTTVLLSLQSGQTGSDIPAYLDYPIGGENSVRGWGFAARRGKDQFITTLEYRHMTWPTRAFHLGGANLYAGVAIAVFADVGSAWTESNDFSRNTIAGGGVGLRLFVPFVDMIRLDFSFGDGFQTAVGINEKAVAQRGRVR